MGSHIVETIRPIYGLRTASAAWQRTLNAFVCGMGFVENIPAVLRMPDKITMIQGEKGPGIQVASNVVSTRPPT
jgi:hypothetical protein